MKSSIQAMILAFVLFFAFVTKANATTGHHHLILLGGGAHSPESMAKLMEWAGGPEAQIMVISWGTDDPKGAFASMKESLSPLHPKAILEAPIPADNYPKFQEDFTAMLNTATGVFFTGGDQNFIMQKFTAYPQLLSLVKEKFETGAVFGGTSAGTAIMAERMMTGNCDLTVVDPKTVEMTQGLGLLKGALVDQHFIRRQRANRLFGLMLNSPETLGIGIDEDSSIAIEDNHLVKVVGPGLVMIIDKKPVTGKMVVSFQNFGDNFVIDTR